MSKCQNVKILLTNIKRKYLMSTVKKNVIRDNNPFKVKNDIDLLIGQRVQRL